MLELPQVLQSTVEKRESAEGSPSQILPCLRHWGKWEAPGAEDTKSRKLITPQRSGRGEAQEMRCSLGFVYLFSYYLLQFCGHTWIFSNMTARFLSFGSDALVGTFYFVGVMMSLCQILSVLELFHIADGIEECQLFPRLVQVIERNFLLFLIISQEEFQSKTVVCVLFYLWNILHLVRYPYQLMCLISTPSFNMLWACSTLAIPVYILSVITEGISILQVLPYYESESTNSVYVPFPNLLLAYLPVLAAGSGLAVRILLRERSQALDSWNRKTKPG